MRFKTWRTWTQKELCRLEELRLQGLTAAEIADVLGRTFASVKCRLSVESIVCPPRKIDRWLAVMERPLREAAAIMGTKIGAVKQRKRKLRRAGFDIPELPRRNQYGLCLKQAAQASPWA